MLIFFFHNQSSFSKYTPKKRRSIRVFPLLKGVCNSRKNIVILLQSRFHIMNTTTKATEEQMIAEAAYRMRIAGLPQSHIDSFIKDNIIQAFISPSGDIKESDRDGDDGWDRYVDEYGGYPWGIIEEGSQDANGNGWLDFYILFVSEDPQEWEKEREELLAMEPTMFRVGYNPTRYPDDVEEEFIRKKIRLTEKGTVVLA